MPKRKVALHGRITGSTPVTTQKYIIEIRGECQAPNPAEAKELIFKAVKEAAKAIPGAHEFWVSQPRGPYNKRQTDTQTDFEVPKRHRQQP